MEKYQKKVFIQSANLLHQMLFTLTLIIWGTNFTFAQVQLSQQVIGSAGGFGTVGNTTISSTTGEAVTTTLSNSNNHLTQGFQQPLIGGSSMLSTTVIGTNTSCNISKDGVAIAKVLSGVAPFTFQWFPFGETNDTIKNLAPGKYWVTITSFNGLSRTDTIDIKANEELDCRLKIYTGISPNGDTHNDKWEIDGINFFPQNEVLIFNRWGDKVWGKKNYDNTEVVWEGKNQRGELLPDGTYFYIVTTNAEEYKGWVEITR